jgi:L-asparaginase
VLVVLGGEVHAADDVAKTHTSSLTTFKSPNLGPLGSVRGSGEGGLVAIGRRRVNRRHVATTSAAEPVHLITAVTGDDGRLLEAAIGLGSRGIVVAATGGGNTSAPLLEAATTAMGKGIPVVLVSRVAAGAAGAGYAFPGGGATWVRAGAILGGSLSGPKARVVLSLGVGAGLSGDGLAALLADPIAG